VTQVTELQGGKYGVQFEFDDGWTDFAELSDRKTAEFYAAVQWGQELVVGVNPLLLNAETAELLRNRKQPE
jgi:hypothetical protein